MEEEKQELNRTPSTEATKLELTVDEVIEEYVGSLGCSQLLHVFLVSLAWMFDSQNTLITIFSDAQPPAWRCKEENGGAYNSTSLSSCVAAAASGRKENVSVSVCGLVPGTWEWVGGDTSSIIAEWGLICDRKFLAAIPASLFFIGSLLGCAVYGHLADSCLGRKKAVLLACILTSITSFITSLSPNIWIYALLRFANGFMRSGIGICCLVLSTEAVGRKWRGQVGQYGFFFFTAGFLSLPLIAYPTRNCWRNMYRFISILPLLYSLIILPFVSESPRWLFIMGRNEEALDVLKRFATLNGKRLPVNLSLANQCPSLPKGSETNKTLWTTRWASKRMALLMAAGLGVGFVYYGIQLNVENLNFNIYFTVALNAMIEIPAVFFGGVLLSIINRRLLLSLSAYTSGVSCILCAILSGGGGGGAKVDQFNGSWAQLTVEAIGFMASSMAFNVLYVYSVELFPTNVRNFAVSIMRQALMSGASIAPLLVALGRLSPSLSFVIFGIFSTFSGLVSFWLPETKNAPLYETLEQQEEGEKQSCAIMDESVELGKQTTNSVCQV